jgi:hypothetical protein
MAPILSHAVNPMTDCACNQATPPQLTPSSAIEHAENTGTQRQRTTAQDQSGPLTH